MSYLYLDLSNLDTNSFLKHEFIMNCNQNMSFNAKWSNITDGVFYIDNMTALTTLKN